MFDTIDKNEWNLMQKDIIRANEMINRQKSIQVLNEIRSEINSEKMENQSEVSIKVFINYSILIILLYQLNLTSINQKVETVGSISIQNFLGETHICQTILKLCFLN